MENQITNIANRISIEDTQKQIKFNDAILKLRDRATEWQRYADHKVKGPDDKAGMKVAKEYRLAIRRERLDSEDFIDNQISTVQNEMEQFTTQLTGWKEIKKVLNLVAKTYENALKFEEDTLNRQIEVEIMKVKFDRIEALTPYVQNPENYIHDKMTNQEFDDMLNNLIIAHNERLKQQAREEEEEKERKILEAEEKKKQILISSRQAELNKFSEVIEIPIQIEHILDDEIYFGLINTELPRRVEMLREKERIETERKTKSRERMINLDKYNIPILISKEDILDDEKYEAECQRMRAIEEEEQRETLEALAKEREQAGYKEQLLEYVGYPEVMKIVRGNFELSQDIVDDIIANQIPKFKAQEEEAEKKLYEEQIEKEFKELAERKEKAVATLKEYVSEMKDVFIPTSMSIYELYPRQIDFLNLKYKEMINEFQRKALLLLEKEI